MRWCCRRRYLRSLLIQNRRHCKEGSRGVHAINAETFEAIIESAEWYNRHHPPVHHQSKVADLKTYQRNPKLTDRIPGALRPSYMPFGLWQYTGKNTRKFTIPLSEIKGRSLKDK